MIENIKEGSKYTLLIENSLGLIVDRKVTINKIYVEPYAQHKETLVIHYKEKGKRTVKGTRFIDGKVSIIEGWIDIKNTFNSSYGEFKAFQSGEFEEVLKANSNLNILYNLNQ